MNLIRSVTIAPSLFAALSVVINVGNAAPAAGYGAMGASETDQKSFPKEVKSKGAVSPAIRAVATRTPVTIPASAVRRTIVNDVRQRG